MLFLIRKHENKNQTITTLENIETVKSNKWTTLTHTGTEFAKLVTMLKRMYSRIIKKSFRTNNKLNNLTSNKMGEKSNVCGKRIYELFILFYFI